MDVTTSTAVGAAHSPRPSSAKVHVGLDVHKDSISIAVAHRPSGFDSLELVDCGQIRNNPSLMKKRVERLSEEFGHHLHFIYEAGPCGYGLLRRLRAAGWRCDLVAPTAIPKNPGDRVKTDRRDARALAKLSAIGYLDPLWVPDPSQEAFRNLIRDRLTLKELIRHERQRIQHFLLRQERRYEKATKWTEAHHAWLLDLRFDNSADQLSLHHKIDLLADMTSRLQALERDIDCEMQDWVWTPVVNSLRALRGVDRLTAITLLAELGDMRRFPTAPQLMAYLGLTSSEHSSGPKRRRGAITKTGNSVVRRLLIESAWTYRFPARETKHIQLKASHASDYARQRAWHAQKRLCRRYQKMTQDGKQVKTVVTAIARELAGYIWDIACHEMPPVPDTDR